ncbi:hypothetical protein P171DRAFT_84761 [Karstenula rhodostoma CBS 690.94]|uniref:Uncharacterized protein n=1 Tax=Karstenula rhodostoma CBS 690.94 TaxID=1392251 RepID=A0A9P4PBF0_9PLEO|nr:hypothetical protein P171DRAFT_84761 [Karstenula rhodostoma CBS 690.94]
MGTTPSALHTFRRWESLARNAAEWLTNAAVGLNTPQRTATVAERCHSRAVSKPGLWAYGMRRRMTRWGWRRGKAFTMWLLASSNVKKVSCLRCQRWQEKETTVCVVGPAWPVFRASSLLFRLRHRWTNWHRGQLVTASLHPRNRGWDRN